MKTNFLINESIQALRHNILRSTLTAVGIVVGIISVTIMLGLGSGLTADIMDKFSSFATGDLSVSGGVRYSDLDWIKSRSYVDKALATKSIPNSEVTIFNEAFNPEVSANIGDFDAIQSYDFIAGRLFDFNDIKLDEKIAIVTTDFEKAVEKETGQTNVLGQRLNINGQSYEIVGEIEIESTAFGNGDGKVIIPYNTVIGTLSGSKDFSFVAIKLKNSDYFDIAAKDILAGLNASRYLEPDSTDVFNVMTAQAMIEAIQQTTKMITIFLGVIGGIALFVGGIGTMNMMLTTVTERTKEIGLRKAVGARDQDILLQILTESIILTSISGGVGILIAYLLSSGVNQLLAGTDFITIYVSWKVIMFSTLVAISIGVAFGIYPARRASKLQPVVALRSE